MSNNFYNEEDNQFRELRAVLKDLPKIKAEENFEYNLMTKIHNKQFGLKSSNRGKFTLFGFFKPALAVGIVAILVFVINQNQTSEIENPFTSMPKIRSEIANENKASDAPKEFVVAETPGIQSDLTDNQAAQVGTEKRLIIQENDVITVAQEDFPFPDQSFDLDSRLRNDNSAIPKADNRVLAGSGSASQSSNRVYFEGFYTGSKSAKKTIDSLRNESFKDSDTSKQELKIKRK